MNLEIYDPVTPPESKLRLAFGPWGMSDIGAVNDQGDWRTGILRVCPDGLKRRYVKGVDLGLPLDDHGRIQKTGERVTVECHRVGWVSTLHGPVWIEPPKVLPGGKVAIDIDHSTWTVTYES